MLKKKNRLPLRAKIKKIKAFHSPYFTLKVTEGPGPEPRFAFLVSKKVDKRAVARNRLKRVFRSFLEENIGKIKGKHDFIFILKKDALGKSKEELFEKIEEIFRKEEFIK